jgi:multidrug efflux pump subunit AcrA (membrane-fusion protein)
MAMSTGLNGMSLPRALTPTQTSEVQETGSGVLSNGVLPPSQTLLVSAHQSSGTALLRARLQPSVEVIGRAPLAGQISRVMVSAGELVQVNDRILQISSGATTRPPVRAERAQARAEQEQVAAAEAQEALQLRLQRAQTRLVAAQDRVERARSRVEEAQSVIGKLQRGEITLAPPEEPSPQDAPRETGPAEAALPPQTPSRDAVVEAQNAVQAAQREADRAAQKATAAHRALTEAEQEVGVKEKAVFEARAAVEAAQKRLADGSAKESDVAAAKSAVNEAETAAATARSNAQTARTAATAADRVSATARAAARQSGEKVRALRNLQDMPLFADKSPEEKPAASSPRRSASRRRSARREDTKGKRPRAAGISSIAEAAQMVESATSESRSAAAAARRIKNEVEDYERQVRSTQERLNSTGEGLEAAQQRVLDSTIQANLSVVRAPSSGTVLWIASVADEVGPGEAIITIGRSEVLEARMVDHSGAWKNLKRDDVLSGVVQMHAQPANNIKSMDDAGARAGSGAASSDFGPAGSAQANQVQKDDVQSDSVPVTARVREVIKPAGPNQPAVLRVAVFNPRRRAVGANFARRRFRPGMALLCSVDKPGSRRTISVPSAAVLREGKDQAMVAVLAPATGDSVGDGAHRIEWRPVTLGQSNGVQQEIAAGLQGGERIALQPLALRAFANSNGAEATVRLG